MPLRRASVSFFGLFKTQLPIAVASPLHALRIAENHRPRRQQTCPHRLLSIFWLGWTRRSLGAPSPSSRTTTEGRESSRMSDDLKNSGRLCLGLPGQMHDSESLGFSVQQGVGQAMVESESPPAPDTTLNCARPSPTPRSWRCDLTRPPKAWAPLEISGARACNSGRRPIV